MSGRLRFLILALLATLLASAVTWLHRQGVQLHDLTPAHIRDMVIASHGWAPVLYLAAYGQPIVPVPATIMILAAGLVFGPIWGIVLGLLGSVLRAILQFELARMIGRETVQRLLRGRLAAIDHTVGRHGFRTVLAFRLFSAGLPFDIQNIALGLSPVSRGAYALATFLAMIPIVTIFVFFGHSLTDLRQCWKMMLIVISIGLLVGGVRWLMRRRRARSSPN